MYGEISDAIKEITVMAAKYQAQYGKTAGANINVVTKNGTKHFHGSLYYYFRNEALNANSYFNKYAGQARGRYRYNTVGGTIGGPIFWPGHFNTAKNKLFFFVSIGCPDTSLRRCSSKRWNHQGRILMLWGNNMQ